MRRRFQRKGETSRKVIGILFAIALFSIVGALIASSIHQFRLFYASSNSSGGLFALLLGDAELFLSVWLIYYGILSMMNKASRHGSVALISLAVTLEPLTILTEAWTFPYGGESMYPGVGLAIFIGMVIYLFAGLLISISALVNLLGRKRYSLGSLIYALIAYCPSILLSFSVAISAHYVDAFFFLFALLISFLATTLSLAHPLMPKAKTQPTESPRSDADTLLDLKSLLDDGIITLDEYEAKKNEILKRM